MDFECSSDSASVLEILAMKESELGFDSEKPVDPESKREIESPSELPNDFEESKCLEV
jgi:hypothetical protein